MSVDVDNILDKLPSFSPSVEKLLSALKQDYIDPKELESLLISCPIIAGRVLQISNSSFYGFSRQIGSLSEACVILGQHTLRSLIYTLAVLGNYRDSDSRQAALSYDALWAHSLYSACLTRVMATQAHMQAREDAPHLFTAALFQHLGLIVLDNFDQRWIDEALVSAAKSEGQLTIQDAISEASGLNYLELSYRALEYWNFPNDVCQAIQATYAESENRDKALLNVANVTADLFGFYIADQTACMSLQPDTLPRVITDDTQHRAWLAETDTLFHQMARDFLGNSGDKPKVNPKGR